MNKNSNSPAIIELCTRGELPQIISMVKELAVFEKEPDAVVTQLEDYESASENLIEILVAKSNDVIVGMALYYPAFSTWKGKMMYLEDLYVKTEYRNKGIGQQLFDSFIERAKYHRCKLVKWQVLDWNTNAVAFYEKNSAKIEKQWWNGKILF